jgi:hypothetical protein
MRGTFPGQSLSSKLVWIAVAFLAELRRTFEVRHFSSLALATVVRSANSVHGNRPATAALLRPVASAQLALASPLPDNVGLAQRFTVSRGIRPGDPQAEAPAWLDSTPESRMDAVWELTLQCLAWRGAFEPRLQRSVVRIQRAPR